MENKVNVPIISLRTFLETFDFTYVHNENGNITLTDTQGGNFDNIETEEFSDVKAVVERLDKFYHDYIYTDLCNEFDYKGREDYTDILEWLNTKEDKTFLAHHIALVECITNPDNVVDLLSCDHKELATLLGQVIDERETYMKDLNNPSLWYVDRLYEDVDNELAKRLLHKEKTKHEEPDKVISLHKPKKR